MGLHNFSRIVTNRQEKTSTVNNIVFSRRAENIVLSRANGQRYQAIIVNKGSKDFYLSLERFANENTYSTKISSGNSYTTPDDYIGSLLGFCEESCDVLVTEINYL